MRTSELHFDFPEELIATAKSDPTRVMWVGDDRQPQELTFAEVLTKIPAGDVVVVNDTKVVKRRVFANDLEILFLQELPENEWQVLMPAKNLKIGARISLPMGATAELIEKGRPQELKIDRKLTPEDFEKHGELPLPPYIQRARGERHNRGADQDDYQTAWAKSDGSLASPTASLHFKTADIQTLKDRGVRVKSLTLHVGLGTFLPVTSDNLDEHVMHAETVTIPRDTWLAIEAARGEGRGVWALGTTVARAIESAAAGLLTETPDGFHGETRLFMKPGAEWRRITRLMTNFHQPESTLLALVASFHSLESVKSAYQWAIERRFKLFSYGDFSVWIR
ncbi:MAG: tRNA preQ1(34) S-adenosylmethionine ribosyltransferase-isomerase QueA [Bdellovibrionaceae bacterium]|nr:tRNA preQ1(34) S-adenosylmethionine ribosyltransferase-isomerase QueA [Pseudobdellovibrionaceae bacterium]